MEKTFDVALWERAAGPAFFFALREACTLNIVLSQYFYQLFCSFCLYQKYQGSKILISMEITVYFTLNVRYFPILNPICDEQIL